MSTRENPTFHHWKLHHNFKDLREKQPGLHQRVAAGAMGWSEAKLMRIETGHVKISAKDRDALLKYYGADDATVAEIVATWNASRRLPWWSEYADLVTPEFALQLGFESSAFTLDQYYSTVIPGLLQTPDYAREVMSQWAPKSDVQRQVELRMRRQESFEREDAPKATFILDEPALRRHIGGPAVLKAQLRRLLELMTNQNIDIEVIPHTAGAAPAMMGSFILMTFAGVDARVASFESPAAFVIFREDEEVITKYFGIFAALRKMTLKDAEAEQFITKVVEDLDR